MNPIVLVLQVSIAAIWAAILVLHTRRLLRLTRVPVLAAPQEQVLRQRLRRAWWWLGREEFWSAVERDLLHCLLLTLLLITMAWGVAG